MQRTKLVAVTQPRIDGIANAEELIAYCARVSNPANQANKDTAGKLIRYLIDNHHWSPLEMVHVVIEIQTTRDIARQILRHRSFAFQEFSQRYAEVVDFSEPREARLQDTKNRQNSVETDDESLTLQWSNNQIDLINHAEDAYKWALNKGIAKEQARAVLPEGLTSSTLYMAGTLRSWVHYCMLRRGNGTQKEHAEIAKACWDILGTEFPAIADLFVVDELEEAVNKYRDALLKRLRVREAEGRTGWQNDDWEDDCIDKMIDSAVEGDPLDTGGYAVFAHYHGWKND